MFPKIDKRGLDLVLIKKGTKKLTSAKKQQLEEEKITKPTKPLDVEVK